MGRVLMYILTNLFLLKVSQHRHIKPKRQNPSLEQPQDITVLFLFVYTFHEKLLYIVFALFRTKWMPIMKRL